MGFRDSHASNKGSTFTFTISEIYKNHYSSTLQLIKFVTSLKKITKKSYKQPSNPYIIIVNW